MKTIEIEQATGRVAQRDAALLRANRVRKYRGDLKRELKAGDVSLEFVLFEADPADVDGMQIFDVLAALPRWGETRADRVMRRMKLGSRMKLAGLSRPRREELAARVAGIL